MANGKKRGPISKAIKGLCISLYLGNGSEVEFKKGIEELIERYGCEGPVFLPIAMALRKWTLEYCKGDTERALKLTDEVDVRIRDAWKGYRNGILRT